MSYLVGILSRWNSLLLVFSLVGIHSVATDFPLSQHALYLTTNEGEEGTGSIVCGRSEARDAWGLLHAAGLDSADSADNCDSEVGGSDGKGG